MSGERLLVIDDESSLREFLTIFLGRHGFEVRTASSGEAGLDVFDAWRPDIVLTDLNMPGIDGMEVLRQVKARAAEAGRDVPVVLITAFGSISRAVEAMRDGAFDYVAKPFINDELRLTVAKSISITRE